MELDDLDNLNKNEFLPLLSQNIKQELFDTPGAEEGDNTCDSPDKQLEDAAAPAADSETTTTDSVGLANKCVWCSQALSRSDNPKLLECLHVACENCVKNKFSNATTVLCIACSMPNQQQGIIDNQFLVEQLTLSEEQSAAAAAAAATSTNGGATKDTCTAAPILCSGCSDEVAATSWCVECSEYICDSCVQAHQRLKITKDHTIKPKEEADVESSLASTSSTGPGEKNIMCPVHAQEKLSLFCETCDRLTCRDCQLVDHRDHKYKFANEIAADTRSTLNSLLGEISYKRVLLTSAMKVIDDRQSLIAEKKKESVSEIKNMVMRVTNAINHRSKILVMRLNEVCDSKLRVLNEKKQALQHLSGHTDHCIDFVQNALDKGSDSAVLFSKKALVKHLQQVKCQRADIPNPEIPVRIQVQLNGVAEISREITQMGTIIVDGKVYPPQLPSLTPQGVGGGGGNSTNNNNNNNSNNNANGGPSGQGSGRSSMPGLVSNQTGQMQGGRPQQQASPNIPPMIRMGGMIPPGIPNATGQETFQMYPGNPSPNPSFPSQSNLPGSLNRQFSQNPTPSPPVLVGGPQQRFPPNLIGRGGGGAQNQGPNPLVSSSTHPQNIDISLRSLLNSQTGNGTGNGPQGLQQQQQQQQHQMQRALQGQFGVSTGNMGGQTQQPAGVAQQNIRGGGHYGRIQGSSPGAYNSGSPGNNFGGGSNNNPNLNPGPRFQGQCPPNCGPTGMQRQQSMPTNPFQNQNNGSGTTGNQFMNNVGPYTQNNTGQQQQPPPPPPHPQIRMSMGSGAKWHIPQSMQQQLQMSNGMQIYSSGGGAGNMSGGNALLSSMGMGQASFMNGGSNQMGNRGMDSSFKINLKSPPAPPMMPSLIKQGPPNVIVINSGSMPSVSSTIPKTPSPSVNDSTKDSDSIDKMCAESMNDLMVTIAKLDSNGVQVLPEGRTKATSPLVHSSTDITTNDDKNGQKDDPNEDWCAVCLDGGELMCCDKCPKVFHQNCHIPPISNLPDESETWQCLLCMAVNDIPGSAPAVVGDKRAAPGDMTNKEFKILQRVLLEMYCQYDISLPFREPEPATNDDFYNLINNPICLEEIRRKLDENNSNHYRDIQSFVNDVRLIFKNSLLYHNEMKLVSKIIDDGRALEQFFDQLMAKWLPGYSTKESDDDERHKYPLKRGRQSIDLD